jgi:hypothetical protein
VPCLFGVSAVVEMQRCCLGFIYTIYDLSLLFDKNNIQVVLMGIELNTTRTAMYVDIRAPCVTQQSAEPCVSWPFSECERSCGEE